MMLGGVSVITGLFPRLGAAAVVGSMIPTTLAGHSFWSDTDPQQRKANTIQFLKNLGMVGGCRWWRPSRSRTEVTRSTGEPEERRTSACAPSPCECGRRVSLLRASGAPGEVPQQAVQGGRGAEDPANRPWRQTAWTGPTRGSRSGTRPRRWS